VAAFDIANHFHEWTADYHGKHPHLLDPSRYPTLAERRNLYTGYLSMVDPTAIVTKLDLDILDAQVRAWSAASHAMWAVWGIVQAREQLEGEEGEFDYVSYARCRFQLFYKEIAQFGL
jgi:choline kinase